jgi:hypothetical protein
MGTDPYAANTWRVRMGRVRKGFQRLNDLIFLKETREIKKVTLLYHKFQVVLLPKKIFGLVWKKTISNIPMVVFLLLFINL